MPTAGSCRCWHTSSADRPADRAVARTSRPRRHPGDRCSASTSSSSCIRRTRACVLVARASAGRACVRTCCRSSGLASISRASPLKLPRLPPLSSCSASVGSIPQVAAMCPTNGWVSARCSSRTWYCMLAWAKAMAASVPAVRGRRRTNEVDDVTAGRGVGVLVVVHALLHGLTGPRPCRGGGHPGEVEKVLHDAVPVGGPARRGAGDWERCPAGFRLWCRYRATASEGRRGWWPASGHELIAQGLPGMPRVTGGLAVQGELDRLVHRQGNIAAKPVWTGPSNDASSCSSSATPGPCLPGHELMPEHATRIAAAPTEGGFHWVTPS